MDPSSRGVAAVSPYFKKRSMPLCNNKICPHLLICAIIEAGDFKFGTQLGFAKIYRGWAKAALQKFWEPLLNDAIIELV